MIGKRYQYKPGRTGTCIDICIYKVWLLLKRDDVQPGEQPRVAIHLSDPDLKICE